MRQTKPSGMSHFTKIHRQSAVLTAHAPAQTIGQYRIQHRRHNHADQNQQAAHQARTPNRRQGNDQYRQQHIPRIGIRAFRAEYRDTGQVQPDDRNHRTGNDWRHQLFNPLRTGKLHQQPD